MQNHKAMSKSLDFMWRVVESHWKVLGMDLFLQSPRATKWRSDGPQGVQSGGSCQTAGWDSWQQAVQYPCKTKESLIQGRCSGKEVGEKGTDSRYIKKLKSTGFEG